MNDIKKTKHGEARIQQRGIPQEVLDLIMEYGTDQRAHGNATKCYLNKRGLDERAHELKSELQLIDKAKKVRYIESDGGEIITVYREY